MHDTQDKDYARERASGGSVYHLPSLAFGKILLHQTPVFYFKQNNLKMFSFNVWENEAFWSSPSRELVDHKKPYSNWSEIDTRKLTFHRLWILSQCALTIGRLLCVDKINGLLTNVILKGIWFSTVIRIRSEIYISHYLINQIFSFFKSKLVVVTFIRLTWHIFFRW